MSAASSHHPSSEKAPIRSLRARVAISLAWLLGCAVAHGATTPDPEDIDTFMRELERDALEDVRTRYPESAVALDQSVAHAVFSVHATKVPLVGKGEGIGVAVDRESGQRTYLRITHTDVGGGLGDLDYRLVIVFSDRSDFARLQDGELRVGAGVHVAAGDGSRQVEGKEKSTSEKSGREIYLLADSGAAANWSVRLIQFSVIDKP
jgi:hypothetical protein